MHAMSDSAEGDCYLCVPPNPGGEAAAKGASASAAQGTGESAAPGTSESASPGTGESALSGIAPTEALHTLTLDSGASCSFFRDSTTLTLLSRPDAVSLADPSGGPILAHSSTVLPGQRVTHCTCSRTGCHLATFTRRPGSSLYTLTTASSLVVASGQVFAAASKSSPVSAPCSCRPLSLPPLPRGPAPTCVPCVEVWQRAAPHSSEFPPTEAPLQTLHMDVWGPARVNGQGHECYFLLVVDDYSLYTTVFPLRRKGETEVRRIGMVMDVARTSMIHAAAPHFLWPFAVQYADHQINLQPRVSFLETTPTLRWTGKVGDASVFRVWGSRAFVRDTSADKLSSRAVPCIFLGFPPDAHGWQFYHPTSRRVLSSQDVTFDELVSYYRLFPYRTASLPPPPLFLAPGAPPVDPLPPQGPAPSGVSQVDPVEPVEVAADSGAARGTEPAGARPGRAESGGPPGVPSRREPLSPQRLREWYARRFRRANGATGPAARGASRDGDAGGAAGAGAAGDAGPGGAGAGVTGAVGGPTGVGAARGAGAAGPRGARTGGTGAAGAGGVAGVGAVGAGAVAIGGAAGVGAAGGTGAGGAAGVVAGDPGAEGTNAVSAVSRGAARPRPFYVPLLLQPASPLPGPSPYSGPTRGLTERREPESRPASPESRPESLVCAVCTSRRVPRQCPPPVPGTHCMTLRPSTAPQRVPQPSPPASSLPDGPDPESDSLRAASPTITHFLATAVTDPSFESTAASALVAQIVDFAAACRLGYATSLVAESESASVCPPSVGGECALGTDVLEDRQEEFECFATAVPPLVSMLLAPEGDLDAPDIPTPRSYAEAIEGPYSSQWQTAMATEMASWKSTGTYVDEVPPPGANIISGMWIFRVKRPLGSPPVFKVRYVDQGFSQRQGVDFFQTFSPTPKMTTLRMLLHVAA
ncbi:unnamed protein product [Closterium sp. NIES-53]